MTASAQNTEPKPNAEASPPNSTGPISQPAPIAGIANRISGTVTTLGDSWGS